MDVIQVVSTASDAQVAAGVVAASCVGVAILALFRERRRVTRHDPDAVGWVDWNTVQMLALIGAAVALLVLAKSQ